MGGVSMEWKVFSLSDIAHYSQGKQIPLNLQYLELNELRERFIRIVDFTSNWSQEPRFVDKDPKYLVNIDDIVMIRYGTPGKVFRGHKGIIANNLFKITFNEEIIDKDYAYWYLNQDSVYKQLMAGQSSSTMPAITFGMLKYIMVRVPPISYQRRIASILSSLDRKIELNNKINADLEEMAQAIFKNWFVDFEPFKDGKFVDSELGMIPEGWKVGLLGELCNFKRGKNLLTKNAIDEGVPVVAGGLEPSCYHNVANTGAPVITVSGSGANAGFMRMYHVPVWASDCSFIDISCENFYFVYCFLKVNSKLLKHAQTGAVQPHVKPSDIHDFELVIPDEESIYDFQDKVKPFFDRIASLQKENSRLSTLRDTLLPRLMSGELEVPE